MLTKRIIPCLDIKDGRVVKGVKFLGLKDAGDPVEVAAIYDGQGADELVFLDITASCEKRKTLRPLVERIAEVIYMPFTVGGGISTLEDISALLCAGADKVSLNTAAVLDPGLISGASRKFGAQCIVTAIDARRSGGGWEVTIHGGRTPTGKDAVAWAKEAVERGSGEILLTSMDSDGTENGYDLELMAAVSSAVPVPVIASGGAGCPRHFLDGFISGKADACLAASIFHYRKYSVREVKEYLSANGVEVRLSAG